METTTEIIPASEVDDSTLRNAESVELAFQPFRLTLEELTRMASGLEVTGVHQIEIMEAAKKLDKDFLALEKAVEARHKERKEYFLVNGRKVDSARRAILDEIEPIRKWLKAQASFREIEEARIKKALHEARLAELTPYDVAAHLPNYGELDAEQWATVLSDAKFAHEGRLARERELEAQRVAKEEEDRQIRKRAAELEEENRKQREAMEAQQRAAQEEVRRVQAVAEAEALKFRQQAQAEQAVKDEAARVERARLAEEQRVKDEAAATALRAEREKAEKLQREADEEKARKDAEEAEKRKAEEAAVNAPDNEKIQAIIGEIEMLEPVVLTMADTTRSEAVNAVLRKAVQELLALIAP